MDLKGRNFLTLKDFTPKEITYLLDLAADLKEKKKNGVPVLRLERKRASKIQPVYLEECMTESNIVDSVRKS